MKRAEPLSASELAINDCVYWLGPPSVYSKERPKVIRITDIITDVNDPEIDFYVYDIQQRVKEISSEDIKPIPLTHHRLIKNGFVKDEMIQLLNVTVPYYKIRINDNYKFCLIKTKDGTGYRILGVPSNCIKTIKYVHQLQNLLRCCGAFELANNFKP